MIITARGSSTRLIAAPQPFISATFGKQRLVRHYGTDGQLLGTVEFREPIVEPPALPPFAYDPTVNGRTWLKQRIGELAKAFADDLREQAAEIERGARDAGWTTVPPRHRAQTERRRFARRLMLRALRRYSWVQIAREGNPRVFAGEPAEVHAIRTSVIQWADNLGVPLPET